MSYDFSFTRLIYQSGNWNTDQKMPANFLHSLMSYTNLRVDPREHLLELSDPAMLVAPFCYLSGHRLVEFTEQESEHIRVYLEGGGFLWVDDCNHDIDGLFAKSFESEMARIFGEKALQKLPSEHPIYRSFFSFAGPPATGMELNGWGDNLVHDYLRGISFGGRLALLYSNQDYGCEWDYHYRNKRFLVEDNTKFAVNIAMYALLYEMQE